MLATAVTYKMRNRCLLISILALASSAMLATSTFAAEAGTTEHEGVSLKPQMLVQFGGFGITNSMLVTWIVAAGIIIFSQIATRRVKAIPSGIQNFWEWLVEGLHNFLENIIGRDFVAKGILVFCDDFHFYSVRELVRTDSRNRNNRLGSLRRVREISMSIGRCCAVATRT